MRLLDQLAERISERDQDWFRSYLWGGEEGLLADELTQTLIEDRIPIDTSERALLRALLYAFDAADVDEDAYPNICFRERALASLNVVDGPVNAT